MYCRFAISFTTVIVRHCHLVNYLYRVLYIYRFLFLTYLREFYFWPVVALYLKIYPLCFLKMCFYSTFPSFDALFSFRMLNTIFLIIFWAAEIISMHSFHVRCLFVKFPNDVENILRKSNLIITITLCLTLNSHCVSLFLVQPCVLQVEK